MQRILLLQLTKALDTRIRIHYLFAKWKRKQGVPVVDKAFWVVFKHKLYIL